MVQTEAPKVEFIVKAPLKTLKEHVEKVKDYDSLCEVLPLPPRARKQLILKHLQLSRGWKERFCKKKIYIYIFICILPWMNI